MDVSWCLSYKRDLVLALAEPNPMSPQLLLWQDGPLSIFYAPWDWINTAAKVMLVGITPGYFQATEGLREAQRCLRQGLSNEETLRRANEVGSFSGPMRTNLVAMLDGIGLDGALGLDSTARLFDTHHHLAAKTSAISYPVFVNGQNYGGGNPPLTGHRVLCSFVRASLGPRVAMAGSALVVPLGKAAQDAVTLLIRDELLERERCLLGFPHPSGQNGHRVKAFRQARDELTARVRAWFSEGGGKARPLDVLAPERSHSGGRRDMDARSGTLLRPGEDTMTSAGTLLNSHQRSNVHALLVRCPRCGAQPGERCQGAESHPGGYRDTLHKGREEAFERRLDAATAELAEPQAGAVRRLFINPSTAEERRAVMAVLLRHDPDR
jgi:hypothetical protein